MGLFDRFTDNSSSSAIEWIPLDSETSFETLIEDSKSQGVLLFKHSSRCGISSMMRSRLERQWQPEIPVNKAYLLNVITHRELSREVAALTGIQHESPQVLVFVQGKVVHHASHGDIHAEEIQNYF